MRNVVVATHGHCFDGLCSAVMFTRLYQHVHPREPTKLVYRSMGYGPGQNGVDPALLDGDDNAILDFRFSPSPKLTWYFDHHVSAFPASGDRDAYEAKAKADGAARTFFHDVAYGSCTKLIADVGRARFGLDVSGAAELVRWADMIDSAAFPNAEMAVSRAEPVLQLMTVVENKGDSAFLAAMVPRLLAEPLRDVARARDVAEAYAPLAEQNQAFVDRVKKHAEVVGGTVVLVDLSSIVVDVAAKFVTYALWPASAYSVLLTRSTSKCKISIGYNPWSPIARKHDIAKICERHGGGGHPVVGAISLSLGDLARAQKIARDIADELSA